MFLSYLPLGIYVFMLHELIEDKLRHVYWGNYLHITSSVYKKEKNNFNVYIVSLKMYPIKKKLLAKVSIQNIKQQLSSIRICFFTFDIFRDHYLMQLMQ